MTPVFVQLYGEHQIKTRLDLTSEHLERRKRVVTTKIKLVTERLLDQRQCRVFS